ncbi:MAG: hypothetical protein AAF737_10340 [Pseudomonadota bacterium]
MEKQTYKVTNSAPDEIYEQRVKAGDKVDITPLQAEMPIKRGWLEAFKAIAAKADKASEKTDGSGS